MLILPCWCEITWYSDVIDNMTPTRTRQEEKNPKATHMMVHCRFFSLLASLAFLSSLKCPARLRSGGFSDWEESSTAPVIFTIEQSLAEWEMKVGRSTRELLRFLSRNILEGEKDPNLNNLQQKIILMFICWILGWWSIIKFSKNTNMVFLFEELPSTSLQYIKSYRRMCIII